LGSFYRKWLCSGGLGQLEACLRVKTAARALHRSAATTRERRDTYTTGMPQRNGAGLRPRIRRGRVYASLRLRGLGSAPYKTDDSRRAQADFSTGLSGRRWRLLPRCCRHVSR
jgi:hypothetical protein